jgi:hypothetical protein
MVVCDAPVAIAYAWIGIITPGAIGACWTLTTIG